MGFDGGQLMLLALGACFANVVYREAGKRDLDVHGVRVVVECDWSGEPPLREERPLLDARRGEARRRTRSWS